MANKIDLNNFRVVKFGNIDIERNYINDILHAIVQRLDDLEALIVNGGGSGSSGAPIDATYVTAIPEAGLTNSSVLLGEDNVITITPQDRSVEVGIAVGGITTPKLADESVTIPKIAATGTPDSQTFLGGDAVWKVADKTYVFPQSPASASWTINHNLNKYPSVFVEDSGGNDVIGEIVFDDLNNVTLNFSAAFSGTAYLN